MGASWQDRDLLHHARWCLNLLHRAYSDTPHLAALVSPRGDPLYSVGAARVDLESLLPLPDARPDPTVIDIGEGHLVVAGLDADAGHLVLWLDGRKPGPKDLSLVIFAGACLQASMSRLISEERLRVAEEVAIMGDITSRYAHEMKNLLAVIRGSVDLLDQALSKPRATAERIVARLKGQARELESLALALLAMRRRYTSAEDMVQGQLDRLLKEIVRLVEIMCHGKNITVVAESCPLILAFNSRLLREALLNVVKNAVEASPPGATIRIGARKTGDVVQISVSDEGPGIPDALLDRVFDPFFTTKTDSGGTGLGLVVTRHIIENVHGGRISVLSRDAGGVTFIIELPAT